MFTIVTQQKKADRKLFSKKMKLTNVKQNGVTFSLVEVKKISGIHNQKILSTIGNMRVILSKPFEPQSDKQFNLVDESLYSSKLMQNGVEYLLSNCTSIKKHMSVTLIDIQCRYQGLADILIRHFNTLRIVTNRKQLYQNYVDTKLYDCGATVIVESSVKLLNQTALYVSPDGILFDKMNHSPVPVISVSNIPNANTMVIHSFRARTPSKYHEIMPDGICEHTYQAALYNYCGIRNLAALYPVNAMINSTDASMDEIALILSQQHSQMR
ncbi:MAG: hypothetical protein RR444_01190 [Oscillospiraceae bacterium]